MNKFNLKFNAPIQAQDKNAGKLQYIVVNEKMTRVTHLIITKGTVLKKAFVLPLSMIQTINTEGIHLSLFSDELRNYPQFEEKQVGVGISQSDAEKKRNNSENVVLQPVGHQPQADGMLYIEERIVRQGVEAEDVLWSSETAVYGQQSVAGNLSQVIVYSEDGRIHELIMQQGKLYERFILVPYELVERATDSAIYLQLNNRDIEGLIEFAEHHPEPSAVQGDTVTNGVEKEAPLISNLEKDLTEELVESGLLDTAIVELICDRQVVTLTGTTSDQKTKDAINSLVEHHPHVLTVNNELQVTAAT